jgi:hypothetical protein
VAKKKTGTPVAFEADPPPPGVVRLPKYVVREKGVALTEYELLTPSGRVEVAEKRYLSPMYRKTIGPLAALVSLVNNPLGGWSPNAPEAMALYEQDEAIRRNHEIEGLMDLAQLAEAAKPAPPAPSSPKKQK